MTSQMGFDASPSCLSTWLWVTSLAALIVGDVDHIVSSRSKVSSFIGIEVVNMGVVLIASIEIKSKSSMEEPRVVV